MTKKTHADFFAGIGGFSLACQQAGYETKMWVEINPFCQKILKYYHPHAKGYSNIITTDFTPWRGKIDLLTGGFPCQPFSHAGKRQGESDDRFLWPNLIRAVREIQPNRLLFENVAGLFSILEQGKITEVESKAIQLFCENEDYEVNSTIDRVQRRVIARIIEEIGAEGYVLPTLEDGTPIIYCLPACATGAPHRRDRVWFVAYRRCEQWEKRFKGESKRASRNFGGCAGKTSKYFAPHHRSKNDRRYTREPKARQKPEFGKCAINRSIAHRTSQPNKPRLQPETRRTQQRQLGRSIEQGTNNYTSSQRPPRPWQYRRRLHSKPHRKRKIDRAFYDSQFQEHWLEAATRLCRVDDGLSRRLDTSAISKAKWREESLKGFGNAISPPLAYQIIKAMDY